MVTSLYLYEFRDINLILLYQPVFRGNNLALLIKSYIQVVIVLAGSNFALL